MPATISVGTIAMLCVSQASGTPATRPAAPDSPAQTHSSSAVSPRTTTGWRLRRCGRKVTSPSRGRLSRAPAMVAGPQHAGGLGQQPDADDQEDRADRHRQAELAPGGAAGVDLRVARVGVVADADEHRGDHEQRDQQHDVVAVVLQRLHDAAAGAARRVFKVGRAASETSGVAARPSEASMAAMRAAGRRGISEAFMAIHPFMVVRTGGRSPAPGTSRRSAR